MKKLLFILSLLTITIVSKAQFGGARTFSLVKGDTLTNTDSVFKDWSVTAGYSVEGVTVGLTKYSGTVAGKVYLYASMDATNYFVIDSATYSNPAASSDHAPTFTSIANMKETLTPWVYYYVAATSTGTVSAKATVSYTTRKYTWQ